MLDYTMDFSHHGRHAMHGKGTSVRVTCGYVGLCRWTSGILVRKAHQETSGFTRIGWNLRWLAGTRCMALVVELMRGTCLGCRDCFFLRLNAWYHGTSYRRLK